eukprot:COSAG01_NODE_40996_length_457_cov_0.592179_1_plen_139_part_10
MRGRRLTDPHALTRLTQTALAGLGTVSVVATASDWRDGGGSAAAGHEMAAGVHCAHFTLLRRAHGGHGALPAVGVVGAGFDATRDQHAMDSAEGWLLNPSRGGHLYHGGNGRYYDWEGKAAANQLKLGDVVVRSHQPAA